MFSWRWVMVGWKRKEVAVCAVVGGGVGRR
jgi:hypothetical protein